MHKVIFQVLFWSLACLLLASPIVHASPTISVNATIQALDAATLTQNTRGLPLQNADTGVLQDFYSYDGNANITSITDQLAAKNRSMAYDGLDRLTTANAPAIWGTGTYAYNVLDDLTASGLASYSYDGLGRRVYASALNPQPSRTTVYGQGGQLLFSNSQQNAVTNSTRYVYLGGKLIAEDGTAGVVYNHTDALGSPVARSNASGQLLSTTSYEPYGKTAAGTNPAMVGFTGHVNDGDTGLVQMQQRYYDPLAARFMSEDPVMTDANTGPASIGMFMLTTTPIDIQTRMGEPQLMLLHL